MNNVSQIPELNVWDLQNRFKPCRKKQYEIWVCKPPVGTVVVNRLEQFRGFELITRITGNTGKPFITAAQMLEWKNSTNAELNKLYNDVMSLVGNGEAYMVKSKDEFVLFGSCKEMWIIRAGKLANTYTFLSNNEPVEINSKSLASRATKDGTLYWTKVRTIAQSRVEKPSMACFVPRETVFKIVTNSGAVLVGNFPAVRHGYGDFIVCGRNADGSPDLNNKRIVNGEVFALTYDNHGWTDCLISMNSRLLSSS